MEAERDNSLMPFDTITQEAIKALVRQVVSANQTPDPNQTPNPNLATQLECYRIELMERIARMEAELVANGKRFDRADARMQELREDTNTLREDMNTRLQEMREDMNTRLQEMRADMNTLRVDMNTRYRATQWTIGIGFTFVVAIITLYNFLG